MNTLTVGKLGRKPSRGPLPGDRVTVSGTVFVFVDKLDQDHAPGTVPVLRGTRPGESLVNLYSAMHGTPVDGGTLVTSGLGSQPYTFSLGVAYPEILEVVPETNAEKATRLLRQPRRRSRCS